MPELPEVETMCRGIACFRGEVIATTQFPRLTQRPSPINPRPKNMAAKLHHARILDITRLGKRAVLRIRKNEDDMDSFLVFEPRMTGLLLRVSPPTHQHVRLIVKTKQKHPLIFWDRRGLGTITLFDKPRFESRFGSHAIGPDALIISGPTLYRRIHPSRRYIKVALLDQKILSGVGNIYASEILHEAKIDPRTRCHRLTQAACDRIAAACSRILHQAIKFEGSSIGDETYRTADNRPGRYQRFHKVYGRSENECFRCSTTIKRIVQLQRSTFFCPQCQHRL